MTNNNQVNWDEIPEGVEAVVTFNFMQPSYYKHIDGMLYVQGSRSNEYLQSGYIGLEEVRIDAGDKFHLRPTPITQPTPEPPESTQVETSEVEATTAPEFDWSSVEDDVEAVIIYEGKVHQYLKTVKGVLFYKLVSGNNKYEPSQYKSIDDREENIGDFRCGATLLRRPPATTPPKEDGIFLEVMGDTDLRLECRAAILSSKPSISTILQEAQQSILKHHGVTGKVKFTVTCS